MFELIEGDIRSYDVCMKSCENIDYVLHQAAWGSVPRSVDLPLLYEEINVKGTLNMLEAARRNDVKRFIFASSSSVYGDDLNLPKREGFEGRVLSPYALTKKANEEYAKLYTKLYGLDTYGLRYFNVFGRRQDPCDSYSAVIPKFINCLLSDEPPIINGNGNQSRDFTHIDNVIDANLKACLAPDKYAGEAFNVAYGEQVSINTLYNKVCDLLGKSIKPLYGPDRVGDITHSIADISKATKQLGYSPKYSFETGLEYTIGWYKFNFS